MKIHRPFNSTGLAFGATAKTRGSELGLNAKAYLISFKLHRGLLTH
jgi:hypothetical protein